MKRLYLLIIIFLMLFVTACSTNPDSDTPDDNSNGGENSIVECTHSWESATCTEPKTCSKCGKTDGKALGHTTESGICSRCGENSIVECTHSWESATCTEPKTCSKCGKTDGKALGHTTESGICSRCGENLSAWKIGEYVDEFNTPIGKKYMITESYGTFSNSATTNSTLYAKVQIDSEDIGIMLWKYGNTLLKGTYSYENYSITILDDNNTKHYFTGTIYKGGTRIYFNDSDRGEIISLLSNNKNLSIYLKSSKYSVSTYLFTIETKGFNQIYSSII